MTEQEKKKTVNVEDMQSFGKVIHNKGIGSEGICTTAADTAAKEVTVGTTFSPVAGATLLVTFQNAITVAGATIAVTYGPSGSTSTLAAKPIYYKGAALAANMIGAGMKVMLRYNGTQFDIIGELANAYTKAEVDQKFDEFAGPTYDEVDHGFIFPSTSKMTYDSVDHGFVFG